MVWGTSQDHKHTCGGTFDPAQFLPVVEPHDGWTKEKFINYLSGQLIPDLQDAGMEATAEDFETAVKFLR
jgi:hypothetical protein